MACLTDCVETLSAFGNYCETPCLGPHLMRPAGPAFEFEIALVSVKPDQNSLVIHRTLWGRGKGILLYLPRWGRSTLLRRLTARLWLASDSQQPVRRPLCRNCFPVASMPCNFPVVNNTIRRITQFAVLPTICWTILKFFADTVYTLARIGMAGVLSRARQDMSCRLSVWRTGH
ncbi:hypothetical protein LCGC14_1153590 [marine sediment metagenome]|uniref:Uncharacterized protein n=1 Tax=marine sediment metagenome TaxID=412755 RepID=A0A0F9LUR0_9ZZZZ